MKQVLLIAALFVLFISCKKGDNRQYSKWYVNNDSFYTNDIRVDKGKARHDITTNDLHNGFQIVFNLGTFPATGSYKLDCSLQNPAWVCMGIIYRDTGYLARSEKNGTINATMKNGKASYSLAPTWFYNSYRNEDSIFVKGTFNEP